MSRASPAKVNLAQALREEVTVNTRTQLAEKAPQIDLPQRMQVPEVIKCSERSIAPTRNDRIRRQYFTPHANAVRKLRIQLKNQFSDADLEARLSFFSKKNLNLGEKTINTNMLKDLTMLVHALLLYELAISRARFCRLNRASAPRGKIQCARPTCGSSFELSCTWVGVYGDAYSLGVAYDNVQEYEKAIECYSHIFTISQATHDTKLQALSANFIGVDYQLLSCAGKEYMYTGQYVNEDNEKLKLSIEYHTKHAKIADAAGEFVAYINLGLACGSLNRVREATQYFQDALRVAVQLSSSHGQLLAVGNLGLLASRQEDLITAAACIDQFMNLAQSVRDRSAEAYAWFLEGQIFLRQYKHEEAERAFDQAHEIAYNLGESSTMKQYGCYLGVARARLQMSSYIQDITKNILPAANTISQVDKPEET